MAFLVIEDSFSKTALDRNKWLDHVSLSAETLRGVAGCLLLSRSTSVSVPFSSLICEVRIDLVSCLELAISSTMNMVM
jgi:hypothetical protein